MSYYTACRSVTSFREIEEMEEDLILPSFRRLRFVDCNKPFWRKLMHRTFLSAQKGCDRWHDYEMKVAAYDKDGPIRYEFTACPAAEFAKKHGLNITQGIKLSEQYSELLSKTTQSYTCTRKR